jgi:hypothetical protein
MLLKVKGFSVAWWMVTHYALSPALQVPVMRPDTRHVCVRAGAIRGYVDMCMSIHTDLEKWSVNHITYIVVYTQDVYHNTLQLLQ